MNSVPVKWSGNLVVMCNHKRPDGAPKPSCGHHGADELRGWLKDRLKEDGLWGRVRVVTASCLDVCPKFGIVVSLPEREGTSRTVLVNGTTDREELLSQMRALLDDPVKSP